MSVQTTDLVKAFCCLGNGETGWKEVALPTCGPLDAILKPLAVCICSSDVGIASRCPPGVQMTLGHEVVGEIVEIGSLVRDFKIGDKCLVPPITPDWGTVEAQAGVSSHSGGQEGGFKFTGQKPGVFAERFHVNHADANLAHLPDGMPLTSAVMIGDMMSTGFFGAEQAGIEYGDSVAVIGIGPVGLMAVAAASIGGAGRVFAVGTRPKCVQLAKDYGATDIISYKSDNFVEKILEANGKPLDRVIIAGGNSSTLGDAVRMIRPGGVVANVSIMGYESMALPGASFGFGIADKTIKGGLCPGGRLRLEKLASLVMYDRVDPSKLITHEFRGIDKIPDAFEVMKAKDEDTIKALVYI